jgi:DNA primase
MDVVEQIRQVANIVDIASQYTTLRQRGKKHVGLCPFHSEKDPSFTVDSDKQLFHCFGCGTGGDIFSLVMEKENFSFPEAVRFLAEKYNIPLPEKKSRSPKALKLEEQLYKISEGALAFFRKNLYNTEEGRKALSYLQKRRIPEKIIQELKIGYAMNSWDALLKYFQAKKINPQLLEKAGLVLHRQNKEGYYDRFRGRIIFPIFTLSGKVVAFGGRTIFDDNPKYLNSPDTPIYTKGKLLFGLNVTKDVIRERELAFLVEGYTDFVALYKADIKNLVASLGTALTPDQVSLARRFSQELYVCYDGDDAGQKAALRAVTLGFAQGLRIKVMILPKGQDPDSFIEKQGKEAFLKLAGMSLDGLQYLIHRESTPEDLKIPEKKAKIARRIIPVLDSIPDPVVRSDYVKQACEALSLDENMVRKLVKGRDQGNRTGKGEAFLNAEKRLLQIVFGNSGIASEVFQSLGDEELKGMSSEPIFAYLLDSYKKNRAYRAQELRDSLEPGLFSTLYEILLEEGDPPSIEEARECLSTLRKRAKEIRCQEINTQIARLEKKGETSKIAALLKQRQEITEELMKQNHQ